MLRMCRGLSHPVSSYTFCSPGDTPIVKPTAPKAVDGADPASTPAEEGEHKNIINDAFMHVVERTQGDFEPNNMIYHQLQKYKLTTATVSASDGQSTQKPKNVSEFIFNTLKQLGMYKDKTNSEASSDGGSSTSSSPQGASLPHSHRSGPRKKKDGKLKFGPFLQGIQAMPPLSVDDLVKEGVASKDGYASIPENEKAARDPLNHHYEALKYSEENALIDPNADKEDYFYFYPHRVLVRDQIPYRSKHFCVLVNLMPIVPLHLLVVPIRCVGTIHALQGEELEDWGRIVRRTVEVLDRLTPYDSNYSIAIQQGGFAGQTVPHQHTHIIPFDPEGTLAGEPEDDQRRAPRSAEEMRKEVELLREAFNNV
ncbi:bis(5'-adenosyl)-triphosphatase [Angomonas deanei]|nr:bis(5'-adenosyl)-triphosphatase [Angomonas deanei]|eukprot:EPY34975.1 bis(5'-adenosyl)-triphosphatase [Angomonas deanei]